MKKCILNILLKTSELKIKYKTIICLERKPRFGFYPTNPFSPPPQYFLNLCLMINGFYV